MSLFVDIKKDMGAFELDVSFEAGNEALSLLGNSGSGKSVTLKCIAGVMEPDEGRIVINDRIVYDSGARVNLKPQERRVGFLFQNYALFPTMTVLENIMAGMERDRRRNKAQKIRLAGEYIKKLQLDGLDGSYPSELSGGQKQRVALARILASDPDMLLLDEPFSALDAALRWEMEQLIRETIKDFDGTCVLVTHDRDEVYRLCDRVAVYRDGAIDVVGEKWDVFAHPLTENTARLTGCKNISPAHRQGNMIIADDWHIAFEMPGDEVCDHIGIRAHRFELTAGLEPYGFEYEMVNRIEDTFSYIYQIRKADDDTAGTIRWEVEKRLDMDVPDRGFVRVPEREILLLRGVKDGAYAF